MVALIQHLTQVTDEIRAKSTTEKFLVAAVYKLGRIQVLKLSPMFGQTVFTQLLLQLGGDRIHIGRSVRLGAVSIATNR